LEQVEYLEKRLNIVERWGVSSIDWQETASLAVVREYRLALDELERLVVSRIFELTKMNMSGTGYKLRKHIAKALQTRSKAVRAALGRFNTAAKRLKRPTLNWEEVVSYSFLAEFDLLRESREEVRKKPWATAVAREALDAFFKTLRADETLIRVSTEMVRLLTYM
ncbi:hypothetical protein CPB85DRAFT_1202072, partial [Mucidula mucida]